MALLLVILQVAASAATDACGGDYRARQVCVACGHFDEEVLAACCDRGPLYRACLEVLGDEEDEATVGMETYEAEKDDVKRKSPFLGKRKVTWKRRSQFLGKRRSPFLGKRRDDGWYNGDLLREARGKSPFLGK